MLRRCVFVTAIAVALVFAPAKAATTVYTDSSNFPAWPNVINSGNAIGPADGASALIPTDGWIAFELTPAINGGNILLTLTAIAGPGAAILYYGRTDGAGGFSALNSSAISLTTGPNLLPSNPSQESFCIGLGGCDVFIVQAGSGTGLALDRALGPNPEPSVWSLMILGFAGVAWRMKTLRGKTSQTFGATVRPAFV